MLKTLWEGKEPPGLKWLSKKQVCCCTTELRTGFRSNLDGITTNMSIVENVSELGTTTQVGRQKWIPERVPLLAFNVYCLSVTTDPTAICTVQKPLYRRYLITNNFSKFPANSV